MASSFLVRSTAKAHVVQKQSELLQPRPNEGRNFFWVRVKYFVSEASEKRFPKPLSGLRWGEVQQEYPHPREVANLI